MLNSLINSFFISIPLILSMTAYFYFDKKYAITDKLSSKIQVDKKWQPSLLVLSFLVFQLSFGVLCISIKDIPANLYFIINGLVVGIVVGFTNRINHQIRNK